MAILEFDFLVVTEGGDVDEQKQIIRDTLSLTEDYGGFTDSTGYLKNIEDPSHFYRLAAWPDFEVFTEAFGECLGDGALDEWSMVMTNNRATGYDLEYQSLPLDAPSMSLVFFHMANDKVKDFEAYVGELKGKIKAHAAGCKAVSGWNIDPARSDDELLLVCGWRSAEDRTAFLGGTYATEIKKKFGCVHHVEEMQVKRVVLDEKT